jgi:hypothetical protein
VIDLGDAHLDPKDRLRQAATQRTAKKFWDKISRGRWAGPFAMGAGATPTADQDAADHQ